MTDDQGLGDTLQFVRYARLARQRVGRVILQVPPTLKRLLAGVAGVAIGFGAQSLVKDFFSGMFLLLENQIRVGDVVEIAGKTGVVEELTLRRTKLRSFDGAVHYVSNGLITTVSNFSTEFAFAVADVSVSYREDLDHVYSVMRSTAAELREDPGFQTAIVDALEIAGVEQLALKLGQILLHRVVQPQLPLVHQHHHGHGSDGLGLRGDPEERVGLHRLLGDAVGKTDGFDGQHLVLARDQRDGPGELLLVHEGLKRGGDGGRGARHGRLLAAGPADPDGRRAPGRSCRAPAGRRDIQRRR